MRKSLELIATVDDLREGLCKRIAQLREVLAALPPELGWHLLPSHTAVQALVIGSNEAALAAMESLRQRGLWVPAIRPPTVPVGTARLRIALSAAHTAADVDALLAALAAHAADCVVALHQKTADTSVASAAATA